MHGRPAFFPQENLQPGEGSFLNVLRSDEGPDLIESGADVTVIVADPLDSLDFSWFRCVCIHAESRAVEAHPVGRFAFEASPARLSGLLSVDL